MLSNVERQRGLCVCWCVHNLVCFWRGRCLLSAQSPEAFLSAIFLFVASVTRSASVSLSLLLTILQSVVDSTRLPLMMSGIVHNAGFIAIALSSVFFCFERCSDA